MYFGKYLEMRVFRNTNVLASAFVTRGICEDILGDVLIFHQFISARTVMVKLE